MVRSPCCDDNSNLKKGPWTPEEDQKLIDHINKHGHGSWRVLPKLAGLNRCGKSCRLRWTNYLRPDIKRGKFSEDEERLIINLHAVLGNKWSRIATHLPGRTDNEIKNFWNTHIRKKLLQMRIDPNTHKPRTDFNQLFSLSHLLCAAQFGQLIYPNWDNAFKLQADAAQLAKIQLLQNLVQIMSTKSTVPNNIESGTSSLLGSQNFNKLFEGSFNFATSTPQDFLNPSLNPQATIDPQAIDDSWACFGNGFKQNGLVLDMNNNSSFNSSYDIQKENLQLPPLISCSPETSTIKQTESKTDMANFPTANSSHSEIFEAWEKLMDDETSHSYWKNILDLTSSTSSPISW